MTANLSLVQSTTPFTRLPWRVRKLDPRIGHSRYAEVLPDWEGPGCALSVAQRLAVKDAEYLVMTANAHPALVASVQALLKRIEQFEDGFDAPAAAALKAQALEALALAGIAL